MEYYPLFVHVCLCIYSFIEFQVHAVEVRDNTFTEYYFTTLQILTNIGERREKKTMYRIENARIKAIYVHIEKSALAHMHTQFSTQP